MDGPVAELVAVREGIDIVIAGLSRRREMAIEFK